MHLKIFNKSNASVRGDTMKFGSYEQKKLFCRSFIDSHTSFNPEQLSWPKLDDQSLKRLQSIPFWPDLLRQQQETALIVHSYAQTVRDPLMKEAIALLAKEEDGLTHQLKSMMEFYDIPTPSPPSIQRPSKVESAFIDNGFEGCLDSFLGFGLFEIAQQRHYLPEALLQVFDSFLDEKAHRIIFFINWWSYWNIKLKQRSNWSEVRGIRALWFRRHHLIKLISAFEKEEFEEVSLNVNFSIERLVGELTLEQFLNICQVEQVHRMQNFNSNLLQPQLGLTFSRFITKIIQFWPQRLARISQV
jgi:hypothetical protein